MSAPGLEPKKDSYVKRCAKDIAAGSFAGILKVFVGQPFDITKVRMQAAVGKSAGMMDVVKGIWKNEGPMAFYKGTTSPLAGISAFVAIQFATNEVMKRRFVEENRSKGWENPYYLSTPQYFFCGSVAGTASAVVSTPVEHIRIRLQMQRGNNKAYKGTVDAT